MNDTEKEFLWSVYAEMPKGSAVQVGHVKASTELQAMNLGGSLCLNSEAARGYVRALVLRDDEESLK